MVSTKLPCFPMPLISKLLSCNMIFKRVSKERDYKQRSLERDLYKISLLSIKISIHMPSLTSAV